jgi:hemolysin III
LASDKDYQQLYSSKEEIAHVVTHGIGILLSIIGLAFLILKAWAKGDQWHLVSFIIFGISLLLLYTSSTLYHSIRGEKAKKKLRKLDHSAIYILIAGTYTPFLLTSLRGTTGWIMFAVIWGFGMTGIIIKLATQIKSKWVSAIIYLVMGWLAIFIAPSIIDNLPGISIAFLAAGGLFYSLGVIFYVWKKRPYHHAIWHLFVLGGSICHYFSIYFIL